MTGAALDEHRLRGLMEVGRALVSELDVEVVLRRVLEVARELTGARYAALGILDESRSELERFLFLGVDEETRAAIGELPRGRGVLGLLIDDPVPLRLEDVAHHPRAHGFPAGHPPMETFLGVPIVVRGEAFGNLYLTEKEGGGRFYEADEQAAIVLAEWAAIAIDNARLYARAENRRAELERAVRGLEAMTEIAHAIGDETNLDRILGTVVKRARALVGARRLVLMLHEGQELVLAEAAGELDREIIGLRVPIEGSLSGQILRSLRSERIHDLSARLLVGSPEDLFGTEARTALFVPMVWRGKGLGVLIGADRLTDDREFTVEDEELLSSFAASAATAVATARSVAEDRLRHSIASAERERARWARELHDDTLQGLGARRVLLSTALSKGDREALEVSVRDVVVELGQEIDKLRALISELRPAVLDEIGLAAAIDDLAKRAVITEGLEIEHEVTLAHEAGEAADRLDPELDSALYRVVQEALTNVAKHARAERVWIRLIEAQGRIEIEIRDDGVGFNPDAGTGGFGLLGMRERISIVGGKLEVSSSPGAGTALRATIPVARAGPAASDAA